jgi:hypothetical protein
MDMYWGIAVRKKEREKERRKTICSHRVYILIGGNSQYIISRDNKFKKK